MEHPRFSPLALHVATLKVMRTLLTFLAAGGSITAFVCWCVVRAGGRPTPRPEPHIRVHFENPDQAVANFQRLADEARKRGEL